MHSMPGHNCTRCAHREGFIQGCLQHQSDEIRRIDDPDYAFKRCRNWRSSGARLTDREMAVRKHTKSKRGSSMVEFCLMAPWILFLFMGTFDFGFYAYAIICTENAARVAAGVTSANSSSAGDSVTACTY